MGLPIPPLSLSLLLHDAPLSLHTLTNPYIYPSLLSTSSLMPFPLFLPPSSIFQCPEDVCVCVNLLGILCAHALSGGLFFSPSQSPTFMHAFRKLFPIPKKHLSSKDFDSWTNNNNGGKGSYPNICIAKKDKKVQWGMHAYLSFCWLTLKSSDQGSRKLIIHIFNSIKLIFISTYKTDL